MLQDNKPLQNSTLNPQQAAIDKLHKILLRLPIVRPSYEPLLPRVTLNPTVSELPRVAVPNTDSPLELQEEDTYSAFDQQDEQSAACCNPTTDKLDYYKQCYQVSINIKSQ